MYFRILFISLFSILITAVLTDVLVMVVRLYWIFFFCVVTVVWGFECCWLHLYILQCMNARVRAEWVRVCSSWKGWVSLLIQWCPPYYFVRMICKLVCIFSQQFTTGFPENSEQNYLRQGLIKLWYSVLGVCERLLSRSLSRGSVVTVNGLYRQLCGNLLLSRWLKAMEYMRQYIFAKMCIHTETRYWMLLIYS